MRNLTLKLEGLQYGDTQNKVKNQLDRINGVQKISMNIDKKMVEITYDWPATDEEIRSCLNNDFKIENL